MSMTTEEWGSTLSLRLLGGLLLFCTGVFLLFHCGTMFYRRKKRRQVRHALAVNGAKSGSDSDVLKRKGSRRSGRKLRECVSLAVIPPVSIIITPPSPMLSFHSSINDEGGDSIGSSSDLVTVISDDSASRDLDNDVNLSPQDQGNDERAERTTSATSLGAIHDVTLVTEEAGEERGEGWCQWGDMGDEEVVVGHRPRLTSMEPGTSRADFNIPGIEIVDIDDECR